MGHLMAPGLWTLLFFAGSAIADLRIMVGVDPSDRESMVISVLDMQQTLGRIAGQPVHAVKSQDLADIEVVIRRQRALLDRAYLAQWAGWLAEETGLDRIRTTLDAMLERYGSR